MQSEVNPGALKEAPEKISYPHTLISGEQIQQVTGGTPPERRGLYYQTEEIGLCVTTWCPDYNQLVGLVTDATGVLRCYMCQQPAKLKY